MANTFTQIYIHIIFAVKGRQNLISDTRKEELYMFISGIIRNNDQKILAINGMPDHVHILIGLKPTKPLSDLVREIKANSSRFINEKKWIKGNFEWQKGFGAFSYSHSQLTTIINYINDQEDHHKKRSFRQEYEEFLKLYRVDYNPAYLLDKEN